MKSETVSNGFQIVASVAVIAGLGLVIFELRQTKQLTRAQLAAQGNGFAIQRELTVMGEAPAAAIARACVHPEAVTDEDAIVLFAYFLQLLTGIKADMEIEEVAGPQTERWRTFAPSLLSFIFSMEHGRWHWKATREGLAQSEWGAEIVALGDEMLARAGPPNCSRYFEAFKKLGDTHTSLIEFSQP